MSCSSFFAAWTTFLPHLGTFLATCATAAIAARAAKHARDNNEKLKILNRRVGDPKQ